MNKMLSVLIPVLFFGFCARASETLITKERVGPLDTSLNGEQIVERFGAENVSRREAFAEGEPMGFQTVLFAGTPRELIITWNEPDAQDTIASVAIERLDSVYATEDGIRTGLSVHELEKLNDGVPFEFYGFGWDYAGYFHGFGEGPLAQKYPWLSGVINMNGTDWEKHDFNEISEIMGDQTISSDNTVVRKLPLRLIHIYVQVGGFDAGDEPVMEEPVEDLVAE